MMLTSMVESDFAAAGLPPLRRGRSQQSGPDAPIEYGTPAGSVPRQGGSRRLHRGSRPNVVLMNVDDTGWGDYGFNNPAKSRDTPHLDALRAEGMRFTDLHAGASVCTPSRAALLTGRIGLRTGVVGNFMPYSVGGLPRTEVRVRANPNPNPNPNLNPNPNPNPNPKPIPNPNPNQVREHVHAQAVRCLLVQVPHGQRGGAEAGRPRRRRRGADARLQDDVHPHGPHLAG